MEKGKFFVSVKNKDGDFEHFLVPEEIYIYVRQLEAYIMRPDESKLMEVYEERFMCRVRK